MASSDQEKVLYLGFGTLLALLVAACAFGVAHSVWLSEKAEMIYRHPLSVSVAIRRVEGETANMRRIMVETALSRDASRVLGEHSELARRTASMERNLNLVNTLYLGPREDLARLGDALEGWRGARERILALLAENRLDEASAAILTEGAKRYAEVESAIRTIAAFAQGKAAEFTSQARQISSRMTSGAILAAMVITGAGAAVAYFAIRSLRQVRERFRSTFEQTALGMAHVGADGRWLLVNRKLCDIVGYSREELLAKTFQDITHPDDLAKDLSLLKELMAGDIPMYSMEKRYFRKDGGIVWVSLTVSMVRADAGEEDYFISAVEDITARKAMERELDKARGYIKNIINSMPSVVIGVDAKGSITHLNATAAGQLEAATGNPVGCPLENVFPALGGQLESIRRAIRERVPVHMEKEPHPANGEIHYRDVLIYPLVANGVEGAVLRIDDVTERVRLAEMMVQTEKMMSVGGLAAGMAHEINNPLGAILQSSQVLLMHLDPSMEANEKAAAEAGCGLDAIRRYLEKRRFFEFLDGIRESARRAAAIVSNMLEFSRKSASGKAPASMAELLDKSVELASSEYDLKKKYDFRHIAIIRDYAPDLSPVMCSRTEIEQVVLNLLKNAAQAMAGKRYPEGEGPAITLRLRQAGDWVVASVEDNGPGMDEAVRKRVFEPFFTTKEPGHGTGLGLSVSYFIVTSNHGGVFAVESEPGRGARFTMELPAAHIGRRP